MEERRSWGCSSPLLCPPPHFLCCFVPLSLPASREEAGALLNKWNNLGCRKGENEGVSDTVLVMML